MLVGSSSSTVCGRCGPNTSTPDVILNPGQALRRWRNANCMHMHAALLLQIRDTGRYFCNRIRTIYLNRPCLASATRLSTQPSMTIRFQGLRVLGRRSEHLLQNSATVLAIVRQYLADVPSDRTGQSISAAALPGELCTVNLQRPTS